jgi:hypothetical protein
MFIFYYFEELKFKSTLLEDHPKQHDLFLVELSHLTSDD